MTQHYSVQLGRWVDDDEEPDQELGDVGFNPYTEDEAPDQELGPVEPRLLMPEWEGDAGTPMPGDNVHENMLPPWGDIEAPDQELGPVDAPPRQQRFNSQALADDGDPDPEDNDLTIGAIETKRPLRPEEWDTTNLSEALARDRVQPVTPQARRNLETAGGMRPPVPLEAPPEQDTWADRGPLASPDGATWAGAEKPLQAPRPAGPPPMAPIDVNRAPVPPPGGLAPPAAPGPMPSAPRDLGPSQLRHDGSTAAGLSPDPDGGAPDQYGVETENADPLQARLARARELYVQKYGSEEGPSAQRETFKPYQPQGYRQTDKDLGIAFAMQSVFGEKGDNYKIADLYRGLQGDYDRRNAQGEDAHARQWIAEHKAREGDRPLSLAEVQQLVMTGMEPEAAVQGNVGATKLASSLGGIGTRERKLDVDTNKTNIGERGKDFRQTRDQDFKGRLEGQRSEDRRRGQDTNLEVMNKKMGLDSTTTGALRPSFIAKQANLSRDQVDEFDRTGAIAGATPEVVDAARNAADDFDNLPPQEQQRLARATAQREGAGVDRPIIAAATARGNPKERVKLRRELSDADLSIDGALSGYDELAKDPKALNLFVKMGQSSGSGLLSKATFEAKLSQLSPAQQAAAGRVMTALSRNAFNEGGKNLTNTEVGMYGAKSGVTLGAGTAIFRDPAVLRQYLATLNKARHAYRKNVQANYGDLEGN